MPHAVSAFDSRVLRAIQRMLSALDDLEPRRVTALRAAPATGSPAANDRMLPEARYVTIYAGQTSDAALDHLRAWRLLAHGPLIPVRSHLTLMRATLESADRCRWHVDDSVDAGTRIGRAIATRRADQVERSKFEASTEWGPVRPVKHGKTAIERLAELDDPARLEAREKAGVREVGYTDTTTLMVRYGHERWYRISSGLGHAKEWALAATALTRSTDPPLLPGSGEGVFSASEPATLAMTKTAVDATKAAIEDLEVYVGMRPVD